MKLNTTFINRENINKQVFDEANARIVAEDGKKTIIPFRKAYMCSKLKQIKRIINQNNPRTNQNGNTQEKSRNMDTTKQTARKTKI